MTMAAPLRWQPPAHSPLDATALMRAFAAVWGGPDPRPILAARLQSTYRAARVILTDSGTDALQHAITLVRQAGPAGASVAIPAYSCFDVATAAVGSGAPLALYDVDPETLAPVTSSLCRCLAEGARTVVVTPLYGVPVDWREIVRATEPWGAVVIEDAAQGHGAMWEGRPLGTLAPVSVLSFGRGKGWTGGGGGAVLCREPFIPAGDPRIARDVRATFEEVVGLAPAAAQWLLGRPALYRLPALLPGLHLGTTRYRPPRSIRPMHRGTAALLEATCATAAAEAEHRRATGLWLDQVLPSGRNVHRFAQPPRSSAGWLRFPIAVRGGVVGLADPSAARALGVMPGYPRTLAELPAVQARLMEWCRKEEWRGAVRLTQRVVTLPTHSLLAREDREALVRAVAGQPTTATGRRRRYNAA